MALSNSAKLGHFVEKLLDFQRVSLNAARLVLTYQELGTFLNHRVDSFKLIAGHKSIEIESDIKFPAGELIRVDKEKITRIMDNLLSNAIKYTPYGGTIRVEASADRNKWYLKVRDTGIGISLRDQRMIFKNVFRADNAVNSEEIGSGIGLKLVSLLVKLHQGKISFRSKLNEGTEFFLSFPLKYPGYEDQQPEEEAAGKEVPPEHSSGPDKPCIVVAEDNAEMIEYMRISLSEHYHIICCSNGKEALEAVTTYTPRLVISDVVMPEMTGFELCRQLKSDVRTSHIPVLLLTGLAGNENMLEGMRLGAIDYIRKPFDQEILRSKISNIFSLQKSSQKQWLEELKNENAVELSNEVDNEFMGRLQELVEKNMDNPELSIPFLCREMGISKTLLYNKVTQLTGNAPMEFIRIIRLKRAANLLLSGRFSVTDVAFQVGIDNPKYFSRVFKEFYGVSPKEYLAKNPLK
ncbi:MAG: ATP-binding protein [Bacteroides sp.]|nr:ATP-binding protein [Bacteroides sp.]